jgi:hypothetical protein
VGNSEARFSTAVTFISVYRSESLYRLKQNPSSRLVEEMVRHMHDMGLACTPSRHEIHIAYGTIRTVATFDVSTSVSEDSGPLGCATVSLG